MTANDARKHASVGHIGLCPDCGKRRYVTRREAKAIIRTSFPGSRMSPYRCGDYFHIGHLPGRLIAGDITRSMIQVNREHP